LKRKDGKTPKIFTLIDDNKVRNKKSVHVQGKKVEPETVCLLFQVLAVFTSMAYGKDEEE